MQAADARCCKERVPRVRTVYIYDYMYIYIYICMHRYIYRYIVMYMYMARRTCNVRSHRPLCVYIYIYIYNTHTHTHTHAYAIPRNSIPTVKAAILLSLAQEFWPSGYMLSYPAQKRCRSYILNFCLPEPQILKLIP